MTITQANPTEVVISPTETGTYELFLESFDQNGGVFTTLKEDKIILEVSPDVSLDKIEDL